MSEQHEIPTDHRFGAAEIGALSHLWRGEVYRSTVWRVRFDTTTNWAVVTTGIAFSASFSAASASPLPLALVGLLVVFFLLIEARRYRRRVLQRCTRTDATGRAGAGTLTVYEVPVAG